MTGMPKLSRAQASLLDALQRGVIVHWMDGTHAYAFRSDTLKHVTPTVFALQRLGLVDKAGSTYFLTPRGKAHTP